MSSAVPGTGDGRHAPPRALRPSRFAATGTATWPEVFETIVTEGGLGARIKLGDANIPDGGVRVSVSSRGDRLRQEPFLGTYRMVDPAAVATAQQRFKERIGPSCVEIWHTVLSAGPHAV